MKKSFFKYWAYRQIKFKDLTFSVLCSKLITEYKIPHNIGNYKGDFTDETDNTRIFDR